LVAVVADVADVALPVSAPVKVVAVTPVAVSTPVLGMRLIVVTVSRALLVAAPLVSTNVKYRINVEVVLVVVTLVALVAVVAVVAEVAEVAEVAFPRKPPVAVILPVATNVGTRSTAFAVPPESAGVYVHSVAVCNPVEPPFTVESAR